MNPHRTSVQARHTHRSARSVTEATVVYCSRVVVNDTFEYEYGCAWLAGWLWRCGSKIRVGKGVDVVVVVRGGRGIRIGRRQGSKGKDQRSIPQRKKNKCWQYANALAIIHVKIS